jgi:hypothetical protein
VKQEVADKIRELAHLIEHATPDDASKAPEMRRWFDEYLAQATPAEERAVRAAVRKLWPRCTVVLMGRAESGDQDAKRLLERIDSLRQGGKN